MKAWVALLTAIGLAATASAGDREKEKHEHSAQVEAKFKALDRDADGQLSAAEVRKDETLTSQFASLDLNIDGLVSRHEYLAKMDVARQPKEPR